MRFRRAGIELFINSAGLELSVLKLSFEESLYLRVALIHHIIEANFFRELKNVFSFYLRENCQTSQNPFTADDHGRWLWPSFNLSVLC